MHPSRRIPLLRGFAGATIATFVALASHVSVGGEMPGMLGIAVPWLLSLMVCTLLAGRRLSVTRLSISVVLSQALFHALFVLGSISPRAGLAPHVHGDLVLPFEGAVGPVIPESAGMWAAHAIAAVLTVVSLHRGERIVRGLVAVASDVAAWLGRRALPPVGHACHIAALKRRWIVRAAPLRRDPLCAAMRRRGPPLLV